MDKVFRSLAGVILLVVIAGCTIVSTSPDVMVAIAPAGGAKWTMDIYQKGQPGYNIITLNINGTPVGTSDWSTVPANIQGTYANHAVQAICSSTGGISQFGGATRHFGNCAVYVDGTQVATLPF